MTLKDHVCASLSESEWLDRLGPPGDVVVVA